MRVIGIDPGAKGAVAVLDAATAKLLLVMAMPPTPADVLELLRAYGGEDAVAYIEKVGGMPGNGAQAMFNFGFGVGVLHAALAATGTRCVEVSPARWQTYFRVRGNASEGKTRHKNRLKERAQQLFPHVKVTLTNADALLIAAYGCTVNPYGHGTE